VDSVVKAALGKPHAAGYSNACGIPEARLAIANHHSYPEHQIGPEHVVVANGCSGALELALTALLDNDTFLLVPQPGFPLYQVIAESHGSAVLHYRLKADRNWECDLEHLEELVAKHVGKVRGIVVNNPSNPTGAVFSERHLAQILEFATHNRLPVVADEVYGDLTFGSNTFHPLARVAARMGREVPIITASGLAKQYLLPGWRVGWITFHDK
jgi:tyrosine aminotransferase